MLDLKIKKVGRTIEKDKETLLILEGDMPSDCVVVFMSRQSWEILQQELPE